MYDLDELSMPGWQLILKLYAKDILDTKKRLNELYVKHSVKILKQLKMQWNVIIRIKSADPLEFFN